MHHVVVKFSKFSSPQAAREHSFPKFQNPADVPVNNEVCMKINDRGAKRVLISLHVLFRPAKTTMLCEEKLIIGPML